MKTKTITLVPDWHQTNYKIVFPHMGNVDEMSKQAIKASRGGWACLRNYARRKGISMANARRLARLDGGVA